MELSKNPTFLKNADVGEDTSDKHHPCFSPTVCLPKETGLKSEKNNPLDHSISRSFSLDLATFALV
jgi:hypothetical protein